MSNLSGIWDGERHLLDPDVHFPKDGARDVIDGWEELEEEDILSPFESPSRHVRLRITGSERSDLDRKRFPMADTEQAWGALSVSLTALAMILDVGKKQYQEIQHTTNTHNWSFQTDDTFTERL